ncbi:O-antigen ligase domain-containing protein [Niveispirillum sp. SYP-B3756]|uniref:O-antigen ligase family protein n=1 Tax=Niveispirillum sp. SYP-B3756 TaxID=2662178 RepID=UPI001290AD06|nr:O-antigen ligase family protein [Niveispirillum sp. SYP-B3756]MQP68444.1 O-antigen ligase domain-containing protein [Niveispirillum sp. SYP-B3756]
MSAHTLCLRLLLAIVVLAPLPLASNRPLPWSALALAAGLLMVGWALLVSRGRITPGTPLKWLYPVITPFALAMVWILIQTVPSVSESLANPLWAEAGRALGPPVLSGRITIDAGRTFTGMMLMMGYGAIFFLSAQLGRHRPQRALKVLAVAGVIYALYGLVLWMLGSETILWMDKWAYGSALTSTFVNRNAYAAYAGVGLICCIALAVESATSVRGRLRDRVERILIDAMPWLIASILLGMALVLTQSRAGLLLTLAGLVILGICLRISGIIRNRTVLTFVLVLLGLVLLVVFLGGAGTLRRLAEGGLSDEARPLLYQSTLAAFLDAPVTGQGLGAFPLIFPIYRDATLSIMQRFDHAHNLHLELLMELGLVATLLLYLSMLIILVRCAVGLVRRRRNQIYPAVALAATTLLGLHGTVDFSLQMPAVAATYAFLLGLGFAQSFSSEDGESHAAET